MSGLFKRLNRKNNKNTAELEPVETRFLSAIHGGGGGENSLAEIKQEEIMPIATQSVGVGGTKQPPP
ncbi:MAG: hypothetical protein HRT35_07640 [Algicola sp.]|nr:hypothetical protein [Algicola sp.]